MAATADTVSRLAHFVSDFNAQASSSKTGSLSQIWMPEAGEDGSRVLNTQGLPYSINGVGDLLALFRCISCKYKFSTDLSKPQQMGAVGRVFTSGEPEMSHNVQRYDQQVYLRAAEAQRCRVHSTLFMPLYATAQRDMCMGVFEVVLTDADVNFAGLVGWIISCLQSENLYTAEVDTASLQHARLGLRALGPNQYVGVSAIESGIAAKQAGAGGGGGGHNGEIQQQRQEAAAGGAAGAVGAATAAGSSMPPQTQPQSPRQPAAQQGPTASCGQGSAGGAPNGGPVKPEPQQSGAGDAAAAAAAAACSPQAGGSGQEGRLAAQPAPQQPLLRQPSGAAPEGMPSPPPLQQQKAPIDGSGSGVRSGHCMPHGGRMAHSGTDMALRQQQQQQRVGSGGSHRVSGSLEGQQGTLGSGSLPGGGGGGMHGSGLGSGGRPGSGGGGGAMHGSGLGSGGRPGSGGGGAMHGSGLGSGGRPGSGGGGMPGSGIRSGSMPGGSGSGSGELPTGSTAQMRVAEAANFPPNVAVAVQQLLQQHGAMGQQQLTALLSTHGMQPALGHFAANGGGGGGGGSQHQQQHQQLSHGLMNGGRAQQQHQQLLPPGFMDGGSAAAAAAVAAALSQHQRQQQQEAQQQQQLEQQQGGEDADGDDMDDDTDDEKLFLRPQPGAAQKYGQGNRVLTYDDLAAQFGYGLKEAAVRLNICPTTLKRACRRLGIPRWPRRELAKHKKAKRGGDSALASGGGGGQQQQGGGGQQQQQQQAERTLTANVTNGTVGRSSGSGPSSGGSGQLMLAGQLQAAVQQQQQAHQMARAASGGLLGGLQGLHNLQCLQSMDQLLPIHLGPRPAGTAGTAGGSLPPEIAAAIATLQQHSAASGGMGAPPPPAASSPLVSQVMQLLQQQQQQQHYQQQQQGGGSMGWGPPPRSHQQQQQLQHHHSQQQHEHAQGGGMGGGRLPPGAFGSGLPPLLPLQPGGGAAGGNGDGGGGQRARSPLPLAPLLSNLGLPRRADSKLQSVGAGMGSLDILAAADFEMSVGNLSVGNSPRIALSNLGGLSQLGLSGFDFTGAVAGGNGGPAGTATGGGGGATGPQNGPAFSTGAMPPPPAS